MLSREQQWTQLKWKFSVLVRWLCLARFSLAATTESRRRRRRCVSFFHQRRPGDERTRSPCRCSLINKIDRRKSYFQLLRSILIQAPSWLGAWLECATRRRAAAATRDVLSRFVPDRDLPNSGAIHERRDAHTVFFYMCVCVVCTCVNNKLVAIFVFGWHRFKFLTSGRARIGKFFFCVLVRIVRHFVWWRRRCRLYIVYVFVYTFRSTTAPPIPNSHVWKYKRYWLVGKCSPLFNFLSIFSCFCFCRDFSRLLFALAVLASKAHSAAKYIQMHKFYFHIGTFYFCHAYALRLIGVLFFRVEIVGELIINSGAAQRTQLANV